eukprot:10551064-Karenia_brevis.AAC.1
MALVTGCSQCPFAFGLEECANYQNAHGYHACGKKLCWVQSASCAYLGGQRLANDDAQPGGNGPHVSQTDIEFYGNGQ